MYILLLALGTVTFLFHVIGIYVQYNVQQYIKTLYFQLAACQAYLSSTSARILAACSSNRFVASGMSAVVDASVPSVPSADMLRTPANPRGRRVGEEEEEKDGVVDNDNDEERHLCCCCCRDAFRLAGAKNPGPANATVG